jgi:short-subunit dehydrogenase
MKTFRGRVAVVTGAGSGIGREVALELVRRGACIALVDRNPVGLKETARLVNRIGGTCSEHITDLGVREELYALPDSVSSALGDASVLVNNAGIMLKSTRFDEVSDTELDRLFAVNLLGTVYCTKAFLPQLLAADEAAVVNVSSLGGLVGFMYQVPYAAAKFGVRGFSEALRMDLMDTNVHVLPVYPGAIQTNIVANSPSYSEAEKQAALRQMESIHQMPASLAAKKIVQGIARNKSRVLIGRETLAMDLIARLLPGAYSRLLFKPVKKMLDASRAVA